MHSHRTTRRTLAPLAALLLLTAAPTVAHAGPIEYSLSGGRYDNLVGTERPYFVGGGARMGAGRIAFTPNAEWLFVEDVQAYTLNLDAQMVVFPAGAASVWVGGGICYRTVEPDGGESVKSRSTNLLVGAGTSLPMKPYGQVKWVLDDDDTPVALSVGIRF